MSGYFMYVCPECKKIFKVQGNNKKVKCNKCGVPLIDTQVTFEEWNSLDTKEKANIKQKACFSTEAAEISKEKKTAETMNCPKCGSVIKQGSKFCPECGYGFTTSSTISAVAAPMPPSQSQASGSFFSGYEDRIESPQTNTKQPKVNLMKCPSCGADIDVQSKKCMYCGAFITSDMRKEREMVLKEGCPKCSSSNIQFKRERQGEVKRRNNKKEKRKIVYKTVGLCNDCGYTWNAATKGVNSSSEKSSFDLKMLLWILGWIYIFPVPLMLLLQRKNNMEQKLKKGIIIAAWAVYVIFFGGFFISALLTPSNESTRAATEDVNRSMPEEVLQEESNGNIKGLSFLRTDDINVKVGQTTEYGTGYLKADVEDKDIFKPDDVEFISENPEVAKIAFKKDALKTTLYFEVTGVSEGETYIYASSKDGNIVSDKIKVKVDFPAENNQAQEEEITRSSVVPEADTVETEIDTRTAGNLYATETVNVREQPSTDSSILGKVSAGTEITVFGTTSDGWSKVDYNGSEGYVKSEYLSDSVQVAEVTRNDDQRSINNAEASNADTAEEVSKSASTVEANGGTNSGNPDAFDSYVPTEAPAGSVIIVNANNGKIHDAGCRKLPNEENRIYFNSLQDALNAGYSDRCGLCHPR